MKRICPELENKVEEKERFAAELEDLGVDPPALSPPK